MNLKTLFLFDHSKWTINGSSYVKQAIEFPSKLFFFCEVEPGSGGETCIVLSHVIYDKMKQKHPEFVQHLEEKGLSYSRVFGKEFDPSSPVGRGWKTIFMTDDKSLAEERYFTPLIFMKFVLTRLSQVIMYS